MKTTTVLIPIFGTLLALADHQAFAVPHTYTGTFTYTFTQLQQRADEYSSWTPTTSVPGLSIGATFSGVYGYQSETIDGTFGANANDYLSYSSFDAHGLNQTGFFPGLDFPNYYNGGIVVSGGHVVSAVASHQAGMYLVFANLNSFSYVDNNAYQIYEGSGTITWHDPYRMPDTGVTWALAAALAVLIAFAAWVRPRNGIRQSQRVIVFRIPKGSRV